MRSTMRSHCCLSSHQGSPSTHPPALLTRPRLIATLWPRRQPQHHLRAKWWQVLQWVGQYAVLGWAAMLGNHRRAECTRWKGGWVYAIRFQVVQAVGASPAVPPPPVRQLPAQLPPYRPGYNPHRRSQGEVRLRQPQHQHPQWQIMSSPPLQSCQRWV